MKIKEFRIFYQHFLNNLLLLHLFLIFFFLTRTHRRQAVLVERKKMLKEKISARCCGAQTFLFLTYFWAHTAWAGRWHLFPSLSFPNRRRMAGAGKRGLTGEPTAMDKENNKFSIQILLWFILPCARKKKKEKKGRNEKEEQHRQAGRQDITYLSLPPACLLRWFLTSRSSLSFLSSFPRA